MPYGGTPTPSAPGGPPDRPASGPAPTGEQPSAPRAEHVVPYPPAPPDPVILFAHLRLTLRSDFVPLRR